MSDAGISGLGDLTRLDAGTTDAYNAPGYWGMLAVRGFTLDPQFNYRRDGLPINAETMLPLTNKQGLELLKGTSGLQAGTSAPGGLLNLVVKRPAGHLRNLSLGWAEQDTRSFAIDLGDGDAQLGWRVNAEYTHLRPSTFDSRGQPQLAARRSMRNPSRARCWRPSSSTVLNSSRAHPASTCWARAADAASIDPAYKPQHSSLAPARGDAKATPARCA
ncbi:MAG: hypothetical protein IPP44_30510 [Ideonella sp.]|nr:hypothetical protein [Ideonella sp.]